MPMSLSLFHLDFGYSVECCLRVEKIRCLQDAAEMIGSEFSTGRLSVA